MPEEARKAITRAGLSLRAPFKAHSVHQIEDSLRYVVKKLHAAGTIDARYSCHDLRHAFTVRLYQASTTFTRSRRRSDTRTSRSPKHICAQSA